MKAHPRPKKATPWKKAVHTFYLVQPVLQFLLLALAVTALSRCSPLSPSQDKIPLNAIDGSNNASERVNQLLSEDWIDQSLRKIGETEVVLASDADVTSQATRAEDARASTFNFIMGEPSASVQVNRAPSLVVYINREELTKLFQQGKVRHDLTGNLHQLSPQDANEAVVHLRDQPEFVNTTAMLVLSDPAKAPEEFRLKLNIKIAIADEQHAVLQISHSYSPNDEAIKSAAAIDAKHLAILID